MYLLGMVAEPVIYLVVWTTIAEDSGGTVGGLTTGELAAYYIVWTFVRNMNLVLLAVRLGVADPRRRALGVAPAAAAIPSTTTSPWFAGSKLPWMLFYLPIAVVLDAALRPDVRLPCGRDRGVRRRHLGRVPHPLVQPVRARHALCFWTTRVGAAFSLYIMVELLLSGRLVPMTLMPDWVQTLAWFLPFQWTFYFPIETLVGDYSNAELLRRPRHAGSSGSSSASGSSRSSGGAPSGTTRRWTTDDDVARRAAAPARGGDERPPVPRELRAPGAPVAARSSSTGLVVFALVYSHTTELNGWSQDELLVVLGVQILMGGVIRAVIQPNMMRFTEEVRDGKLDHALTKPVDAQMLVSVRQVEVWQAVDVLTGAGVIVVAMIRLGGDLGALDVVAFATALVFGAVLLYCFWMLLATLAFWVVNMWHLPELFEGVFQTGRWPIGIYPTWLRFGVTFLVPIAFAVTVPAEAVTSRLEWQTLALRCRASPSCSSPSRAGSGASACKSYTGASA